MTVLWPPNTQVTQCPLQPGQFELQVTVASDSERCPNNRLSLSLTRDTAVTVQVLTRDTERSFEYEQVYVII